MPRNIPPEFAARMVNGRIAGLRETPLAMTRRRGMGDDEAKKNEDGSRDLIASTDDKVRFGSWHERLVHGPGCVDTTSARALCVNHDPNQIAGKVNRWVVEAHITRCNTTIFPEARLQSGVSVEAAVESGALRGVSVSYDYDPEADTTVWDDTSRTVTVHKWRMLEATLTPIPRDGKAQVERSLPTGIKTRTLSHTGVPVMKITVAKLLALMRAHANLAAAIEARAMQGAVEGIPQITETEMDAFVAGEQRALAAADAAQDLVIMQRYANDIVPLAISHGLNPADYLADVKAGKLRNADEISGRMIADKARKAAAGQTAINHGTGSSTVTVTADMADKFRAAVDDHVLSASGTLVRDPITKGLVRHSDINPNLGGRRGFSGLIRRAARFSGEADAESWSVEQAADWFMRNFKPGWVQQAAQRATGSANQVSAGFTNILANVIDKVIVQGYQNYESVTYPLWTGERMVDNFLQFNTAGLTLGNLTQVAEDAPLQELNAVDSGYNATLNMWGGTFSITLQALINDNLGEFFRLLGQIGMIAQRTIDRQVYATLMNATWATGTSGQGYNDTSVAPIGTPGSLDIVRGDFRKKHGPSGEYMGNTPRYLLHPIGMAVTVDRAVGVAQPPGEQAYLASNRSRALQPIECTYLDDPTVSAANYSATNYFAVGGPEVDTIKVAKLNGMNSPQMMEYDAGSTLARKFKAFMPFVPYLATYKDEKGTAARVLGIQRATAS